MTERPILFSGPMVRAILESRKTQTRRVKALTGFKHDFREIVRSIDPRVWLLRRGGTTHHVPCPYGVVGDRLWVRETWAEADVPCGVEYKADQPCDATGWGWRPSIYMPRWASRITLEITDVRCQRLQDISCADAIAEGVRPSANSQTIDCDTPDPRHEFRALWNSINAKRAPWESNPLVWAITFRRVVE